MYEILVKIGADVSDFSRKLSESNKALSNFGKANAETFDAFKKTGATVTGAGVALAGGLGFAVKTAANFESAMSSVAAISGATGEDFELLSAKAREMGASTSFSASEAAEGLEYMALAGWNTQQMLGGIEPILHLAEAGALDLGRASDLVTDSMSALGIEVKDLDGYLDKVAKTSASANTDIDALMEAFVIAGGTFERFNVPLEEANAFLGVMANRGFKGSEAGTALNAIMTRLTASTGPSAKALEELGISAFDSEGNVRGLEAVMKDVEKKLQGLTDEERAHYQTQIAGLNHGKAFSAMLSGLGNEYDDLKDAIIDSDGALIDMRNTMKDNLQGALANLSSAFEEIQIALGEALLPHIKTLVEWIQAAADWFNNLSDATKQKIAIFLALSSVLLIVGGGLLLLIGFIPQIISGFQAVSTVFGALKSAIIGVNLPLIAIVATIGVVVAAIIHLWQTNEDFRNNVISIWENIKEIIKGVWEAIQPGAQVFIGILMILIGVMSQLIGWVVGVVASFVEWIRAFIETHSWIMTVIQVIAVIAGVIANLIVVVGIIVKVFTVLIAIIKAVGAILLFLTSPVGIVIAVIAGLIALVVWLGNKFEWLGNILSSVADFMSEKWNKFLDFFGKGTKDAADEASDAIEGVSKKGQEDLNTLAESGVASTEALNEGVTSNIGEMASESSNLIDGMSFEGIDSLDALNIEGIDAMADMNAGVIGEIGDMTNFSIDDLSSLEIDGIGAMSGLEKGVTSNVEDMASEVKSQIGGMEAEASGDFSVLAKDMSNNAEQIKKSVTTAFADVATVVKKTMDDINKASSSGLKSFGANITKSMSDVSKSINTAMQKISLTIKQSFSVNNKAVNTATTQMSQAIAKGFTNISRITSTNLNANTRLFTTSFNRQNNIVKTSVNRTVQTYSSGFSRVNQIISSGMDRSLTTVNNTGARMTASMRRLNAQFYSAGVQAMAGLRSGLNAGSGGVMATARSIANRVASTVRAALRVQSPSRVLMEIGKWTSIGLAKGIEAYAYLVDKASDMLAESAIPDISNIDMSYATPDGITAKSLAGAVSGTVDVNNRDDRLINAIRALERRLTDLEVVMDGEQVGRIVRPHVNEGNALDATVGRYFD